MAKLFDTIDNKCESCPNSIWEITGISAMENLDLTLAVMHGSRLQRQVFPLVVSVRVTRLWRA